MLKNILKVAVRNLLKYRLFSFISIIGLAVGLALCILIFQYVRVEMAYDSFHENADDLYRIVVGKQGDNGEEQTYATSPIPLGPALVEEYPDIKGFTRFLNSTKVVKAKGRLFDEPLLFADPDVTTMFTFRMIKGQPESALRDKYSAVISERTAAKYFGNDDPMGQTLAIELSDGFNDFTVTGVVRNLPSNSTVKFDILLPYAARLESMIPVFRDSWGNMATRTYVQLTPGSSSTRVEKNMPGFIDKYVRPILGDRVNGIRLSLQPLKEIHLNPQISNRYEPVNNPVYLYILLGIGSFILILACINIINLSVGRAVTRFKEIGVRKMFGSGKFKLFLQFQGESLTISTVSLGLALLLVELMMPLFNDLANTALTINNFLNWPTLLMLLGLVFVVSLAAGGYPALYMSRFNPAEIIKGSMKVRGPGLLTRSLVVLQFTLSVFFIVCTLMMFRQINYMKSMNLGFNDDHVLVLPTKNGDGEQILDRLKAEVVGSNSILSICATGESMGRDDTYGLVSTNANNIDGLSYVFKVDNNFLNAMDIQLLNGRNFSSDYTSDPKSAVIVNEAFVKEFGLQSPLGQRAKVRCGIFDDGIGTIIGVVNDFHFLSLHERIEPALLHISPKRPVSFINLRVKPDNIQGTIEMLHQTWQKIAPTVPFEYYFLDEDFNRQYQSEERWSRILGYAAFFALMIASLGLFGITTLAVNRRSKEIGIRKILGASVNRLALVISGDFLLLVLTANLLAWPLAYYAINRWLENFAYRARLGWEIFVFSAVLALLIALLSVSCQVLKAALADPVKSLRHE